MPFNAKHHISDLYLIYILVLEMTMYDGRMAIGFLVLLGFNVVFVIVAALLVALEVSACIL